MVPPTDGPRVVALGGGTGLYTVLRGLRRVTNHITAVVSMADNGGSSGRLRDEFGFLPPGDVRRCLVALADDDGALLLRQLFEYRFDRGLGLHGHSFGNLFLTALTDILGSEDRAIEEAGHLLRIHGRVLPVTLTSTTLCARLANGHEIRGETDIDIRKAHHDVPIEQVYLQPEVQANPTAIEAIGTADLVVLGPGDLYTSIIPTLLVDGISAAIRSARGVCVYVCNVMTKHGETDGYAASDFLREIARYLGAPNVLDAAILNYHEALPEDLYHKYRQEQARPVDIDLGRCYDIVSRLLVRPLTATGVLVRHDSERLAGALMDVLATSVPGELIHAMSGVAPHR